jgi:hypothetical protein
MDRSKALPEDVETLDGIIHASYALISGKAGEPRNWERFQSLFVDGARMMPAVSGANPRLRVLSVEEFKQRVKPIFETENFWERESGRKTELVGRFAHVLSEYDSLRDPEGTPFARGTNSMQLYHDGERWWIVSIMWNTERGE